MSESIHDSYSKIGYLVYSDRLAPQLDLVHDFASVLCVRLGEELTEAIALVGHGYSVLRKMDVHSMQVN